MAGALFKELSGAILVISHDRAFLESVTERTIELKLGKLNHYKRKLHFFTWRKVPRGSKDKERLALNQKKEIQKEKEFINRFRSNVKKAAMVQSRIKALEKWRSSSRRRKKKRSTSVFHLLLPAIKS